jgi:hypothetical protein
MDASLEELLKALKADMILYKDMIKETASDMIENAFTSYPIFVAHVLPLELGEQLFDHREIGTTFSISASTIEEFNAKGLINGPRTDAFKQAYKDAKEFMCVFLLSGNGGSFVFVPYASETPDPQLN